MPLKSFGIAIKGAREAAGLSQQAAAYRAGVSQSTWSSWERDDAIPLLDNAVKILSVLGIHGVFLFDWMGFCPDQARRLAEMTISFRGKSDVTPTITHDSARK